MGDLLYGALAGEMDALNTLFLICIPLVMLGGLLSSLRRRWKQR